MRRSKAEAEATRENLLAAAEELFAERGITATRLSDVAAAAGVTRGAIYWHFKNKDELINAIIDRLSLPLETAMRSQLEDAAAGKLTLETFKNVLLMSYQRMRDSATVEQVTRFAMRYSLCTESQLAREHLNHNREQNLALLAEVLRHAQHHQQIRSDISAVELARYIRAHIIGIYHQQLSSNPPHFQSPEEIRRSIDLLFISLQAPLHDYATAEP